MTPLKPIQSKKEEAQVRQYLINETATALGISLKEAATRLDALGRTKIVQNGHYEDVESQRKIENFLRIPSRQYDRLDLSQIG